jgi:hypothetical protein
MFFALLVLFSAFLIEGIGTYVSVVGLSALFAHNPVIIILAVALDIGKVVSVSFLYKYWKKINLLMKSYMTVAALVLMIITSTGCFGYLSGQFQHAISGTNQDSVLIQSLEQEETTLQARKNEIDKQIAQLPPDFVRGRQRLIKQFQPEENRINSRLAQIDKQLPELKIQTLKQNVDVGPIVYVAQAFNTDPEHAVKYVIMTIMFVFDPLAISLLLSGNFLLMQREQKRAEIPLKEASPVSGKTLGFEDDADYVAIKPEPFARTQRQTDITELPLGHNVVTASTPPPPPPPPVERTQFQTFVDDELPRLVEAHERETLQLDKSDEQLHQELGRERYEEPLIDQLDHLPIGQPKPVEVETPSAAQPARGVLPSGATRETHTLQQLLPPRAKLEDGPDKHDVTMTGVRVR